MTATARGLIISAGGMAWLVGIAVVEPTYSESDGALPVAFPSCTVCRCGISWVPLGFAALTIPYGAPINEAAARRVGVGPT
jgi:hypothetical protein